MPRDLKCLALDDDRDWIDLIRRALTSFRCNVDLITFLEAEAALAFLRHNCVDLILSDMRMPGMDGVAFVREFRRFNHTTPIIVVSSDVASASDAVTHGASDFVRKGALNTKLIPAIEQLLSRRPASDVALRSPC